MKLPVSKLLHGYPHFSSSLHNVIGRLKANWCRDPDRFLNDVSGVIHIGANTGQERDQYERHNLNVIWIEPIPEIFAELEFNLGPFPKQRAIPALVTDQNEKEYEFNVASNSGASSSILEFKLHKDIWPKVVFEKKIKLLSKTLPSLITEQGIDLESHQALILDTQGSELLILQGAIPILHHFRYIKSEVPDFESYAGCCQLTDIAQFLTAQGFHEVSRHQVAKRSQGGRYYDVVYKRD